MAALFILPTRPVFSANGIPIAGATISFYRTGTLVPQPVYADAAMLTPLGSVIIADAAGGFPSIYFNSTFVYRVIVRDAGGSIIDDIDPYLGSGANGDGSVDLTAIVEQLTDLVTEATENLTATVDLALDTKADRNPIIPYDPLDAIYDRAIRETTFNFWDPSLTNLSNPATAGPRIRPTDGGSGEGTLNGQVVETLAQPSFWQMAPILSFFYEAWKERGDGPARKIAELQGAYILRAFGETVLKGDGKNVTINISDDACLVARTLRILHELTGEDVWFRCLAEMLAATTLRFKDPNTTNTLITFGASPGGIPLTGHKYGILYGESGTAAETLYGKISTTFELTLAIQYLYLFEKASYGAYLAAAVHTWEEKRQYMRTPPMVTANSIVEGLYFCEFILDPAGRGAEGAFATPRNSYFGKPIRNVDSTYMGAAFAMGLLSARLYRLTGEARYLAECKSVAAAIVHPNGYLRTYPDGTKVIGNTRECWNSAPDVTDFVREVLPLPGVDPDRSIRRIFRNTALKIGQTCRIENVTYKGFPRTGYYTGDWQGPETNFLNGKTSWQAEWDADNSMIGGWIQMMTTGNSLSMLTAGWIAGKQPTTPPSGASLEDRLSGPSGADQVVTSDGRTVQEAIDSPAPATVLANSALLPRTGAATAQDFAPNTEVSNEVRWVHHGLTIHDDEVVQIPGSGRSSKVTGYYLNHVFGGPLVQGGRDAGIFSLTQRAPTSASNIDRNYAGITGVIDSGTGDGGFAGTPRGQYFGGNTFAVGRAGAGVTANLTGFEFNTILEPGFQTEFHAGLQIASQMQARGRVIDTAISVSLLGGSTTTLRSIIELGDQNGGFPMAGDSSVVRFKPGWMLSTGVFLDAPDVTFERVIDTADVGLDAFMLRMGPVELTRSDGNLTLVGVIALSVPSLIGQPNATVGTPEDRFVTVFTEKINATGYPVFADNAAAVAGGLDVGDHYRTGDFVKVVH